MPSGGPGHQAQSPESTPAAIDEGAVAAKVENFKRAIELMKERTEREHRDRLQRRAQFKEITLDMDSRDRAAAEEKFLSRENRGLVAKCRMWTTNDFDSLRVIGEGSYGLVHLVRHRRTGSVHALKQMRKEQYTVKNRQNAFNERDCLADVNSDWIVGLHAAFQDTTYIYMLMEFVEGGDLINHLIEWKRFPEQVTVFYMAELLEALDTVHRSGFVHRDVKPENMMITEICGDYAVCKLIDFGLATSYKRAIVELAGTAPYLAPEVAIQQGGYSPKADVWSAGASAFELLSGVPPFGRPQDHGGDIAPIMERLRRYRGFDELVRVFAAAPAAARGRTLLARDFLRWVLRADPEARVEASDVIAHSWLERHRLESTSLTADMVRSLAGYARAPAAARCCLFAIAAKGADDPAELEEFAAAFLDMDGDGDGKVTREELDEAADDAVGCCGPRLDVDGLFGAAGLDGDEQLSYTEFIAGCLYSRHGPMGTSLARRAFEALDHDRDGLVCAREVGPLFRGLPEGLPEDRPFSVDEWCKCLVGGGTDRLGFLGCVLGPCARQGAGGGDDDDDGPEYLVGGASERAYPPSHGP
mmetsp:Transcript_97044/g.274867  ORF Transcript_97044/g.274867 Transcript_97044/m.274867 type:complete len:587 (-) Transcript_97044:63-1823(-)